MDNVLLGTFESPECLVCLIGHVRLSTLPLESLELYLPQASVGAAGAPGGGGLPEVVERLCQQAAGALQCRLVQDGGFLLSAGADAPLAGPVASGGVGAEPPGGAGGQAPVRARLATRGPLERVLARELLRECGAAAVFPRADEEEPPPLSPEGAPTAG